MHATAKMKIDDAQIWASLASYIAQSHDRFDVRNLSTVLYSLYKINSFKPGLLNFDDLFSELELPLIMKMDQDPAKVDPQSISNSILAYSKAQNGSEQFFMAMESYILHNKDKLSP